MNTPIDFPTAKLLKEKGFANITPTKLGRTYYNHLGELNGDVTEYLKAYVAKQDTTHLNTIDAPNIAEVVMWLYDKHGIWIQVTPKTAEKWGFRIFKIDKVFSNEITKSILHCLTPTKAYLSAIIYTLNHLL